MIRTRQAILRQAVLGALVGSLLLVPAAQAQTDPPGPWQAPSPQRIERFLEVFAPTLAPTQELSGYQLSVMRLIAIADAWSAGDRIGAADLILAPGDSGDLEPLTGARASLQAARGIALWWNDPTAKSAFVRYYQEVYLPDPALAADPEAFAERFFQGASITDDTDPARYLYTHLAHYGYTAEAGLTPANFMYSLFNRFNYAIAETYELGLATNPQELDLTQYRTGVIARLVTQINQARRFADTRLAGVDAWGELVIEATTPTEAPATLPQTPPEPDIEEPASVEEPSEGPDIFATPADASTPPPFFPPADNGTDDSVPVFEEITEAPTPVEPPVAPAEEVAPPADPLAGVDIFRTPDDQTPPAAESAPVVPVTSEGDPEVFGEAVAPASEDPATEEPAIIPLEEPIIDGPVTEEPAPEAEVDLFEMPSAETPAPETEAPAPVIDSDELTASREAGEAMRERALGHARTVGGYAMDLVLLWNSAEYATPEGKAKDTTLTAQFKKEKDRLLASLYLLDIYGINARLGLTPESLDQQLLDALHEQYYARKDLNDTEVIRLMLEIDKVQAQLAAGITTRRESDAVALAQQKAYDLLKATEFAEIATQLEATTIEVPAVTG